jgi:hypothetical protein
LGGLFSGPGFASGKGDFAGNYAGSQGYFGDTFGALGTPGQVAAGGKGDFAGNYGGRGFSDSLGSPQAAIDAAFANFGAPTGNIGTPGTVSTIGAPGAFSAPGALDAALASYFGGPNTSGRGTEATGGVGGFAPQQTMPQLSPQMLQLLAQYQAGLINPWSEGITPWGSGGGLGMR